MLITKVVIAENKPSCENYEAARERIRPGTHRCQDGVELLVVFLGMVLIAFCQH